MDNEYQEQGHTDNVHHHHQHHGGEHRHEHTAANKAHFDEMASTYDEIPGAVELSQKTSAAMHTKFPEVFDSESTLVMDFACGTGLISQGLALYAKSIVGIDISEAMIAQYNARASRLGYLREKMHGECVELEGVESELHGRKFDVIVCAMAYHHVPSIEDITRTLVLHLRPGGSLLVADLAKGEATRALHASHENGHTVTSMDGIDEDTMRSVFEGAGLVNFKYVDHASSATLRGNELDVFLASGMKPRSD
ncbi:S-adenosyl-L-methionine-dependent methyltransferase [Laetiporus sulphureus 93-53]|uniref:S-adenosyl-L-methionine-dependent methyltransferase n=1 Tax=Laetiporus sulphureus 93-53 TaxID=1314785 RepID=A0A165CVQ0_9APHY|nr:S-adenosyl-L-methionine-dependent methyltransferase [Laetiporus sulphureus 93-53]KZT03518.1 S-adenosyl-L-methionine-dependent methyltransferase [Laetiporus sulphureus 93-53]